MIEQFTFGTIANRTEQTFIKWSPDSFDTINPHMLICGSSGSGKTNLLFKIIKFLEKMNKHIFIFDLKGGMIIEDENKNKIGNYIELTAWGSKHGINPFEFDTGVTVSELKAIVEENRELTDEESFKIRNSGPKVQVNRIVEILKKNFLPNMGAAQRDVLVRILADTYKMKGFEYNNIYTWDKPLPNLQDALILIEKIKNYTNGNIFSVDLESETYILNMQKQIIELIKYKELKEKEDIESEHKDLDEKIEEINKNINNITEKYISYGTDNYFNSNVIENREWFDKYNIDINKYTSKDIIRTMIKMEAYIISLVDSEVFQSKKPPVKPGLNIVNISGQDVDVQRFIVDVWLGKVFKSCKIRGEYSEMTNKKRGEKCDTFVIIDESKLVAGSSREKNDPYSYLNRIATESRSFGLGIIVVSQSADHFPPEFLKNFYSQIILNTGPADFETVRKSFGISSKEKSLLEFTQAAWGNSLIKTGKQFTKVKLSV